MMRRRTAGSLTAAAMAAAIVAAPGCSKREAAPAAPAPEATAAMTNLTKYVEVPLTTDFAALTANERAMLPLLIEACRAMDDAFWMQAWGDKRALLDAIADPVLRRHAEINYGPWDRLAGNEPFVPGFGAKPDGATFYPADMTKTEFEAAALTDPYTVVRREPSGSSPPSPTTKPTGNRSSARRRNWTKRHRSPTIPACGAT